MYENVKILSNRKLHCVTENGLNEIQRESKDKYKTINTKIIGLINIRNTKKGEKKGEEGKR